MESGGSGASSEVGGGKGTGDPSGDAKRARDRANAATIGSLRDAGLLDRGLDAGSGAPGSFGGWDLGLRGLQALASMALGLLGVPGSVMAPVGALTRGAIAKGRGASDEEVNDIVAGGTFHGLFGPVEYGGRLRQKGARARGMTGSARGPDVGITEGGPGLGQQNESSQLRDVLGLLGLPTAPPIQRAGPTPFSDLPAFPSLFPTRMQGGVLTPQAPTGNSPFPSIPPGILQVWWPQMLEAAKRRAQGQMGGLQEFQAPAPQAAPDAHAQLQQVLSLLQGVQPQAQSPGVQGLGQFGDWLRNYYRRQAAQANAPPALGGASPA